ncbi:uncharacterized protein LOC113346183 [Papaver somniferum]|uniref:uncharacterized protein LOC113346183 n=1 Tax=Papaver somniferum TaxID=3469 RepID=UPI000E6F7210|nr:uncharacterized protein LOC113346183 [Papaver somniferum]
MEMLVVFKRGKSMSRELLKETIAILNYIVCDIIIMVTTRQIFPCDRRVISLWLRDKVEDGGKWSELVSILKTQLEVIILIYCSGVDGHSSGKMLDRASVVLFITFLRMSLTGADNVLDLNLANLVTINFQQPKALSVEEGKNLEPHISKEKVIFSRKEEFYVLEVGVSLGIQLYMYTNQKEENVKIPILASTDVDFDDSGLGFLMFWALQGKLAFIVSLSPNGRYWACHVLAVVKAQFSSLRTRMI